MFYFFFDKFFEIHSEHRIGYKKLTASELGFGSSHQTHIGLFDDVLDFLPNTNVVKTAMLIYNDYCDILDCFFDRIENPDGTYRSPKIRIGKNDSVVKKIRSFATEDASAEWYLVWFGLTNEELVFVLLNNKSKDFRILSPYFDRDKQVIDDSHPAFKQVLQYIECKVDLVSVDLQKELEIIAQVNAPTRKYQAFDIERARQRNKAVGRKGEELVFEYLDKEKSAKRISSYKWMNVNKESGLPFDFIIDEGLSSSRHIDVKSTLFKFEQPIVFSSNEISFVSNNDYNAYQVFRVYDLNKEQRKLKICTSFLEYASSINAKQIAFGNDNLPFDTKVDSIKYTVSPRFFESSNEITM